MHPSYPHSPTLLSPEDRASERTGTGASSAVSGLSPIDSANPKTWAESRKSKGFPLYFSVLRTISIHRADSENTPGPIFLTFQAKSNSTLHAMGNARLGPGLIHFLGFFA